MNDCHDRGSQMHREDEEWTMTGSTDRAAETDVVVVGGT